LGEHSPILAKTSNRAHKFSRNWFLLSERPAVLAQVERE
jgi:hypothetical protein